MKHWMFGLLALCLYSSAWATQPTVIEEKLYYDYLKSIRSQTNQKSLSLTGLSTYEQTLFVDALWDLVEDKNPAAVKALETVTSFHYSLVERLRLALLKVKHRQLTVFPDDLMTDLMNALRMPEVETRLVYVIAAYEEDILEAGHFDLIDLAKNHEAYYDVRDEETKSQSPGSIFSDVFNETPDATTYMNGEYVKSVRLFLYCRTNRLYPCLMVMKDAQGQPLRREDGTLWTNPALASSAKGLPSYSRNGDTPVGVYTIDSVMPAADQQISFGKYRRMILNFVPKSKNETLLKSLLPKTSQSHSWWKPNTTAREIGRGLFRIHGTGKINHDPTTPYFPFMRTSGCVAQRENSYDGMTYQDQRDLLDTIMGALSLKPSYENELKIKGILYVMEIDDKDEPVGLDDLNLQGIQ